MCSMSHNNLIYKVAFSSAHPEVNFAGVLLRIIILTFLCKFIAMNVLVTKKCLTLDAVIVLLT